MVSFIKKACYLNPVLRAFVMIKYQSSKQISIEDFVLPFNGSLDKKNKWVILAQILSWEEMVNVYVKRMSLKRGRRTIDPRVTIGSMIIKHYYNLTDEATIEMIQENTYLQYFLSFKEYRYEQPFTASLFATKSGGFRHQHTQMTWRR